MKKLIPEKIKRHLRILKFRFLCLIYGVDVKRVKFIGVTGSSGKTTTASMIYHLLNQSGVKVGLISTVGVKAGDKEIQTGFHVTTPDPEDLVKFTMLMIRKVVDYVVLESSSHALEQGRLGTIQYSHAVYTNIKSDHLDWHKTWENYARAKARMLDMLKENGTAVLNKDDIASFEFLMNHMQSLDKNINASEYSLSEISNLKESLEGLEFQYKGQQFNLKILGEYNVSNALAALKLAERLDIPLKKLAEAFESFKTIQGRMEVFQINPFVVILDFAHNADSLEKSLKTARKLTKMDGKIISVFGSAGLRDVKKRYEMGKISGEVADITIVTAEDPRTEKLYNINSEIVRGLEDSGPKFIRRFKDHNDYLEYLDSLGKNTLPTLKPELKKDDSESVPVKEVFVFDEENVQNRYDAIDLAVRLAKTGDVVITNGKGHEQTLAFGTIEYPFNDSDAIKKALEASH